MQEFQAVHPVLAKARMKRKEMKKSAKTQSKEEESEVCVCVCVCVCVRALSSESCVARSRRVDLVMRAVRRRTRKRREQCGGRWPG